MHALALCLPTCVAFVFISLLVVVYIMLSGEGKKFKEFVLVPSSQAMRTEMYHDDREDQKPVVNNDE